MKQLQRFGLAGILGLGAAIRCLGLFNRGIEYDDAFSIFLSTRSLSEIVSGTAADTMPPLYYFLLHFLSLISLNLGWLRLLSILLSLGSIVFLFLLVGQLFSKKAGLWAAFFAAISPLQYYHAQDIRMYSLLALTQLAYAWFFTRIWMKAGKNHKVNWVGLVIAGIAAMYSHNLSIFFLVVPDIFLLAKRQWKDLLKLIAAQGVIGLASLPWLVLVPGQVEKIQRAFWTPAPGLAEIIQAVMVATTNLPLEGVWLAVGMFVSLLVLTMGLFEFLRSKTDSSRRLLLAMLVLLPPVLLFGASYLIRPVFVTRGFLASCLVYLGVAAVAVDKKLPNPGAILIIVGLVSASIIGLSHQVAFDDFPRSPFQQAGAFLDARQAGDTIVIQDNKLSFFPVRYYWPELRQTFLPDTSGSPNDTFAPASQAAIGIYPAANLQDAVGDKRVVYFVVFKETIAEYKAVGLEHPQLKALANEFNQSGMYGFNDLDIYQFER
jgi:mannosyltransferase